MPVPDQHLQEIYRLFASIGSEEEAKLLLEDILTPPEVADIAERWQVVKELDKGTPQRAIADRLGVSISKITRGSNALQFGKGGFRHFLDKLKNR